MDFLFSLIPEDKFVVLIHLMFIETSPKQNVSFDEEYFVRILVKGTCQLFIDNMLKGYDYVKLESPSVYFYTFY